ncbi:uncharacterized protein LOC117122942 [Anneissia japonica]|uniref:uncharacterized protein LOC117122942 n=1 Tax=Anneissia japonica TaxID=1529436 RepID=UPI001425921E|nr:uncharacterized protein LOC117122942 [Anneissia japonica]
MDQKYTTYQKPIGDYRRNHEEAKRKAVAAYESLNVGNISGQNLKDLEQKMELKKKECEQLNNQKTKNAEKENNAAHDAALVSYSNKMQHVSMKGNKLLFISF